MGLEEVVVLIAVGVAGASALASVAVAVAVRRVRRDWARQGDRRDRVASEPMTLSALGLPAGTGTHADPLVAQAQTGLTAVEAAARLAADGPNVLPVARRPRAWRRLAAEMVHFFALLFWVAGGLAFLAGLPQLGVAVFVVVVLNAVFALRSEEPVVELVASHDDRKATLGSFSLEQPESAPRCHG